MRAFYPVALVAGCLVGSLAMIDTLLWLLREATPRVFAVGGILG